MSASIPADRIDGAAEAHLRMGDSRRELKDLFLPPEDTTYREQSFPRSKFMRSLAGNKGLALLALGAGGLLLAKPKLIMHFVRMLPVGAIVRMAALRFMGGR